MFKVFSRILPIFAVTFLVASLKLSAAQPIMDKIPIHEAFVPKYTDPIEGQPVSKQPPPPIQESIPRQPMSDAQWISGYWAWIEEDQDFAWVCGVWRRPPPQHVWIPGIWTNQGGNWVWAKGFWSPSSQPDYISIVPPQSIDDQVPPSPGNNYFWVRGYWKFNQDTNNYSWLSGTWEEMNPNWILAPASYVWRPEGYVFVPMHWDYTLDERGIAYTCNGTAYPTIIEPGLIIQRLYAWFPDHIFLYHHWWHFHPSWWGDCWCTPPWWFWNNWWALPWHDMWGLWWWWGHPGAFPPFWMQVVLSDQLPPPPAQLVNFLKNAPKPNFPFTPGKEPLLPKGPEDQNPLPKPNIPNDVKPDGSVTPPQLPDRSIQPGVVTPPPPPPRDRDWNEQRNQPYYPRTPRPQYYPEREPPRYRPRPQGRRPQRPDTYYPQQRPRPRPRPQPRPEYRPQKPSYPQGKPEYRPQKPRYRQTQPEYKPQAPRIQRIPQDDIFK